jgi:hypothetical protein
VTEAKLKEKMTLFGRKLRSYAKWECARHYYSTPAESAIEAAKEQMAESIANMIDETFDVDSAINGMSREEINGR